MYTKIHQVLYYVGFTVYEQLINNSLYTRLMQVHSNIWIFLLWGGGGGRISVPTYFRQYIKFSPVSQNKVLCFKFISKEII